LRQLLEHHLPVAHGRIVVYRLRGLNLEDQ
jgi:hypothetical protein